MVIPTILHPAIPVNNADKEIKERILLFLLDFNGPAGYTVVVM